MRVFGVVFMVVGLFFGAWIAPVAHAQNAAEIEAKLKRLEAAKQEQKQVSKQVQETEQALRKVQREATSLARAVQESEEALIHAEQELRAASKRRDEAVSTLKQHAETYRASVLSVLRMRQLPASMVLAPKDRADDLRLTAASMAVLEKSLRGQLQTLQQSHVRFDKASKQAASARDKLAKKKQVLARDYGKLETVLAQRQTHYDSLKQRQSSLSKEVEALAKTAANLQELLYKLDAQNRAKLSKHLNLRPITRAKGTMRKPVAGEVVKRFGAKKGVNETLRGMEIQSRAGATVLAPFDGEVAFSGTFRDYGQMLLIRHTDGYMSLLAGLSRNNVLIGTKVRAGEPVGKMGAQAAKLYIELRKNRKPIDPANWYAKL